MGGRSLPVSKGAKNSIGYLASAKKDGQISDYGLETYFKIATENAFKLLIILINIFRVWFLQPKRSLRA